MATLSKFPLRFEDAHRMIRRNIAANVVNRIWGFASVYLFVPLYLKYLGIEAYGLVGFYSTLLGVMAFADMGFSATLNRELARLSIGDDPSAMRDLVRTYEVSYLYISAFLAAAVYMLAPFIAERWLKTNAMPVAEIATIIRIMGVSVALQLPSGLYIGGLMGLQRQVQANSLQIAWSVYRGGGSVLVLIIFPPTIFAFAVWQLLSNVVYCFTVRRSLWSALGRGGAWPPAKFRRSVFHSTWRYASGMTGMAVVSIVLTQIDKLAVSKMLTLENLGFYSLAGALAAVPLLAASPVAAAIFPRFTALVAIGGRTELIRLYHKTSQLVSLTVVPVSIVLALFSHQVLVAWTGSESTATSTATATSLLLLGQLMQALTLVPYYVALAHGDIKLNLRVGMVSAVLITPLLLYLVARYGVIGAGASWLIVNILSFFPYMYLFHRALLAGEFRSWFWSTVCVPLVVATLCVYFFREVMPTLNSRILILLYLSMIWSVTTVLTAAFIPIVRSFAASKITQFLGLIRG